MPVTVLLPSSRSGLGPVWCVLGTPGGAKQTTRVGCGRAPGCGIASFAAQHSSPLCPKGFLAIHLAPPCIPLPRGAVLWQLAEPWRAHHHEGGMVGAPQLRG